MRHGSAASHSPGHEQFAAIVGGAEATVDGDPIIIGSARLLAERGIDLGPLGAIGETQAGQGRTPVYVARSGVAVGLITISDPVKPEAAEAVRALAAQGVTSWLVTGDHRATAEAVALAAGIPSERIRAGVLPGEKAALVAELQAAGAVVAMVGDGINDAPALAAADLGIAIGTGADVAIEASDVTLVGGDPRGVVAALALSRRTMAVIRQNLFWAFAYNVVLIPVAMGILYPPFGDDDQSRDGGRGDGALLGERHLELAAAAHVRSATRRRARGQPARGLDAASAMPRTSASWRSSRSASRPVSSAMDAGSTPTRGPWTCSRPAFVATPRSCRSPPARTSSSRSAMTAWRVQVCTLPGVPRVELNPRPGSAQAARFAIATPGTYELTCAPADAASMGGTDPPGSAGLARVGARFVVGP